MTTAQELDRRQFFQPVVETISLTLGLPVVLVRIWRQPGSRWTQVHHTLVGVAAVGFLWFAFSWKLYLI